MLIDKNACNKPLTLDCQVNSNPASNITWYRRRLSRAYVNRLSKHNEQKLNAHTNPASSNSYYTFFVKNNVPNIEHFSDLSNMFEHVMIGTGPTYTIASFDCANALNNLKNRTKSASKKTKEAKLKRDRREKDLENVNYIDVDTYDYESEEIDSENEDPDISQSQDYTSQSNMNG